MPHPEFLPSPLEDKVGYFDHDRFRGYLAVHYCSGLQPPCLRFAMAVARHHARLGTRLRARLCRGPHFRQLNYMSFQGTTPTPPDVRFRIRRFMKQTRSAAGCPAARPVPCGRTKTAGRRHSYAKRRRSTMDRVRWWPTATHVARSAHDASGSSPVCDCTSTAARAALAVYV